jgi:hypothetical protein
MEQLFAILENVQFENYTSGYFYYKNLKLDKIVLYISLGLLREYWAIFT